MFGRNTPMNKARLDEIIRQAQGTVTARVEAVKDADQEAWANNIRRQEKAATDYLEANLKAKVENAILNNTSFVEVYKGEDQQLAHTLHRLLGNLGYRAGYAIINYSQSNCDSPFASIGYGRGDDGKPDYKVTMEVPSLRRSQY